MSDDVRRFPEPRAVLVLHDGRWVPGSQDGWIRWPDGEWMASVTFVVDHDWGRGRYIKSLPAEFVRVMPPAPPTDP